MNEIKDDTINISSPYLILSHHRSGSNFLNNLIQQHPNCECINEPFSMHTELFRNIDLVPWKREEFEANIFHSYLKDQSQTISFLQDLRDFLLNPYYGKYVRGIKETILFDKLEWLKCFLPNLRIIFLVRDPRCVINSLIRSNLYLLLNYKQRIFETIHYYYPGVNIDYNNPVHLCTWSWKIRINLAKEQLKGFEFITIKLEELILNPDFNLFKIMNFLEKDIHEKQIHFFEETHSCNRGKTYSSYRRIDSILSSWQRELKGESKQYIRNNLHQELVQFGYL